MTEKPLFNKILEILEKYGVGESKIEYPTPLARILTEVVNDYYKVNPKW